MRYLVGHEIRRTVKNHVSIHGEDVLRHVGDVQGRTEFHQLLNEPPRPILKMV